MVQILRPSATIAKDSGLSGTHSDIADQSDSTCVSSTVNDFAYKTIRVQLQQPFLPPDPGTSTVYYRYSFRSSRLDSRMKIVLYQSGVTLATVERSHGSETNNPIYQASFNVSITDYSSLEASISVVYGVDASLVPPIEVLSKCYELWLEVPDGSASANKKHFLLWCPF